MLKRNDDYESEDQQAAAFYDARRKWIDLVLEHPSVSHATARVGVWLAKKMNGKDQCCWWSVGRIAKILHMSTKTVTQATTELDALGLMLVVRKKGKGNTYFIRAPFM